MERKWQKKNAETVFGICRIQRRQNEGFKWNTKEAMWTETRFHMNPGCLREGCVMKHWRIAPIAWAHDSTVFQPTSLPLYKAVFMNWDSGKPCGQKMQVHCCIHFVHDKTVKPSRRRDWKFMFMFVFALKFSHEGIFLKFILHWSYPIRFLSRWFVIGEKKQK